MTAVRITAAAVFGSAAPDYSTTLRNNTIVGNTSTLTGGGIRLYAGVLNAEGNIVWGNQSAAGFDQVGGVNTNLHFDYGCVSQDLTGVGNINAYPDFLSRTCASRRPHLA